VKRVLFLIPRDQGAGGRALARRSAGRQKAIHRSAGLASANGAEAGAALFPQAAARSDDAHTATFKLQLDFFGGTFAPFLRASDSPMAIACLRLFTLPPLPPLPERRVPRFLRRMALLTVLLAPLPYLRLRELPFFVAIVSPPLRGRTFLAGCAV